MSIAERISGLQLLIELYTSHQYTAAIDQAIRIHSSPADLEALTAYEKAAFYAIIVASVQRGAIDDLNLPQREIFEKLLKLLCQAFIFSDRGIIRESRWNNTIKQQWICVYFILQNWRDDCDIFQSWKRGIGRRISAMLDEMLLGRT